MKEGQSRLLPNQRPYKGVNVCKSKIQLISLFINLVIDHLMIETAKLLYGYKEPVDTSVGRLKHVKKLQYIIQSTGGSLRGLAYTLLILSLSHEGQLTVYLQQVILDLLKSFESAQKNWEIDTKRIDIGGHEYCKFSIPNVNVEYLR